MSTWKIARAQFFSRRIVVHIFFLQTFCKILYFLFSRDTKLNLVDPRYARSYFEGNRYMANCFRFRLTKGMTMRQQRDYVQRSAMRDTDVRAKRSDRKYKLRIFFLSTLCASLLQYCYHFASFKTEISVMSYFNVHFIHINAF